MLRSDMTDYILNFHSLDITHQLTYHQHIADDIQTQKRRLATTPTLKSVTATFVLFIQLRFSGELIWARQVQPNRTLMENLAGFITGWMPKQQCQTARAPTLIQQVCLS